MTSLRRSAPPLSVSVWRLTVRYLFDRSEMKVDGDLKYYKDMAEHIKKLIDEKYGGSWHVIVGTHFGSFFSYEVSCVTQFWLEHIGFLIFKHG